MLIRKASDHEQRGECDECGEPPEITIEKLPPDDQNKFLCRDCAIKALTEQPMRLASASAVIAVILRMGGVEIPDRFIGPRHV
jgi:hypothetical protein